MHIRGEVFQISRMVALDWFSKCGPLATAPGSRRLGAAMVQNATLQPICRPPAKFRRLCWNQQN